jgi:hypothetical protein
LGGTASALGGGSFANGAITGAFVVLFNHVAHEVQSPQEPLESEDDDINVDDFQKKFFGHVKGLNEIYTDKVPEGYSLNEDGTFSDADGPDIKGICVYLGDGKSDVYLSPSVLGDAFSLYKTLGHEMIHVAHLFKFRDNFSSSNSEYAAHKWGWKVHEGLYGKHPQNTKAFTRKLRQYTPNPAYNYDKFGFTSSIPRGLWNY